MEQNIVVARQVYNDTVLSYDNALETVPTNIVAGLFNFSPREYFETEGAAREAPSVQFSTLSRLGDSASSRSLAVALLWPPRDARPRSRTRSPTRTSPRVSIRTARCASGRRSRSTTAARSAAHTAISRSASGESIDHVKVSEDGHDYTARRQTELGGYGLPAPSA